MNSFFWSQNYKTGSTNGRWVYVATSYGANIASASYTADGTTWLGATFAKASTFVNGNVMRYVPALGMAIIPVPSNTGGTSTTTIATTTNGLTWTLRTTPNVGGSGLCAKSDGSRVLLMDQNVSGTGTILSSTDGITWGAWGTPSAGAGLRNAVWSDVENWYLGVAGSSTNKVQTSTDGIGWTVRSASTLTSGSWTGVAFAPSIDTYVICSPNATGNKVAYSVGGMTFSTVNAIATTYQGGELDWSPSLGLFALSFVNGTGGTTRVATSATGSTWSSCTTPNKDYWAMTWTPEKNLWIATGTNTIMTSTDGLTWTERTNVMGTRSATSNAVWIPLP